MKMDGNFTHDLENDATRGSAASVEAERDCEEWRESWNDVDRFDDPVIPKQNYRVPESLLCSSNSAVLFFGPRVVSVTESLPKGHGTTVLSKCRS